MNRRMRTLACLVSFACFFAAAERVSAQSGGGTAAVNLSLGDVCQLTGGAVALGFGLWHFAVPSLYGWQSYVPEAPQSLVDAVAATNFFLSFSLGMVGVLNVAMPLMAESATPVGRTWLWANVALWTARSAYQLVKPQGTHNPLLQWGMTGAFVVTDLLFLVAAIEASR